MRPTIFQGWQHERTVEAMYLMTSTVAIVGVDVEMRNASGLRGHDRPVLRLTLRRTERMVRLEWPYAGETTGYVSLDDIKEAIAHLAT